MLSWFGGRFPIAAAARLLGLGPQAIALAIVSKRRGDGSSPKAVAAAIGAKPIALTPWMTSRARQPELHGRSLKAFDKMLPSVFGFARASADHFAQAAHM